MASAMTETIWNFRDSDLPGAWRTSNLDEPSLTPQGMHITASASDGSLLTELKLPHPIDVITLTFTSAIQTPVQLFWHERHLEPTMLTQLDFEVLGTGREQKIPLNVAGYAQWDSRTDTIGFNFPKGTDLLLQEIRFTHWNIFEVMTEIVKSFWTFDRMSPISINFVWGPVITFSPIGTAQLFNSLPPSGRSGNSLFYGALVLLALGIAGYRYNRLPLPVHPVLLFIAGFGALWILYDVRMGLELLSYARHDYVSYISKPPGERVLRNYLNFNDMMEQSVPLMERTPEYALLTTKQTPVNAMVRYFALPSIAVEPTGPREDLQYWLVFRHSDVDIDGQGRLTVGGVPWSKPGVILKRFDAQSFLFSASL